MYLNFFFIFIAILTNEVMSLSWFSGGFLSKVGKQSSVTKNMIVTDNVPTWDNLKDAIMSTTTGARLEEEKIAREDGSGNAHTDAKIRFRNL